MPSNLGFLKSIGESVAREYSINWEKWDDAEMARLEKEITVSLKFYETLFLNFDTNNEEHTVEMFEDILENLISGYTLQTIINKKKAVEDLLSAV